MKIIAAALAVAASLLFIPSASAGEVHCTGEYVAPGDWCDTPDPESVQEQLPGETTGRDVSQDERRPIAVEGPDLQQPPVVVEEPAPVVVEEPAPVVSPTPAPTSGCG